MISISPIQASLFWDELEKIGREEPTPLWKKVGIGAGLVAGGVGAAALGAKYGDHLFGGQLYKKLMASNSAAEKSKAYADNAVRIPQRRMITGTVDASAPKATAEQKARMMQQDAPKASDPFSILGIDRSQVTTKSEAKKAYRSKMRKVHTDKGGTQDASAAANDAWSQLQKSDWFNKLSFVQVLALEDELEKIAEKGKKKRKGLLPRHKTAFGLGVGTALIGGGILLGRRAPKVKMPKVDLSVTPPALSKETPAPRMTAKQALEAAEAVLEQSRAAGDDVDALTRRVKSLQASVDGARKAGVPEAKIIHNVIELDKFMNMPRKPSTVTRPKGDNVFDISEYVRAGDFVKKSSAKPAEGSRGRSGKRYAAALGAGAAGTAGGYVGAALLGPKIRELLFNSPGPTSQRTKLLAGLLAGGILAGMTTKINRYSHAKARPGRVRSADPDVQPKDGELAQRHQGHPPEVLPGLLPRDARGGGTVSLRAGKRSSGGDQGDRRDRDGADHFFRRSDQYRYRGKAPRNRDFERPVRLRGHID
jgi:hypothetical protein